MKEGPHQSKMSGCITAVPVCMTEALAALAMQRVFRGDVRLYRDSETAELGHITQFRHFWSPRYRHSKIRG